MNLAQLHKGQTAYIATVQGGPSFRLRLEEMGFVPGQEVTCSYSSPLGTPIVYAMLGQKVALRRSEALQISIAPTMSEALAASEGSTTDELPAWQYAGGGASDRTGKRRTVVQHGIGQFIDLQIAARNRGGFILMEK